MHTAAVAHNDTYHYHDIYATNVRGPTCKRSGFTALHLFRNMKLQKDVITITLRKHRRYCSVDNHFSQQRPVPLLGEEAVSIA